MQPKTRILILSLCLLSLFGKAQDTIAFKYGTKLATRIVRLADTVYYKKFSSGDTSVMCRAMKWDISYIRYANGKLLSFERKAKDSDRQLALKIGMSLSGFSDNILYYRGYTAALSFTGKRRGPKKRFAPEAELAYLEMGGAIVPDHLQATYVNGQPLGLFYSNYVLRFQYVGANVTGLFFPSHSNGFYFKGGLGMSYLQQIVTLTQLNPPINDLYQKSDFRQFHAGLIYGIGIRSNAKKLGFLAEILAVNYLTSLGVHSWDGESYHNCCVLGNVGMFLNF